MINRNPIRKVLDAFDNEGGRRIEFVAVTGRHDGVCFEVVSAEGPGGGNRAFRVGIQPKQLSRLLRALETVIRDRRTAGWEDDA